MSKFAVIKTGGKQYQVALEDKIKIEKIAGNTGDEVVFDNVLLVSDEDGKDMKLGTPLVENSKVKAKVLAQSRAKKITVIKYKPKTRYKRKKGHRQLYTQIEITKIEV